MANNLSTEFSDLIDQIFQRDPAQRITLAKIMEHPWTLKAYFSTFPL